MRSFVFLPGMMAVLALTGCNAIRNDLDKGLAYGTDQERLTRKVDKRPETDKSKINTYVWRASLDAVQAYPLVRSDASHGIIVTDWYASPSDPDDRRQIRIEIMGPDIRRDTLRISIARQVRSGAGGDWIDAPVQATVAQSMENDILFMAKDIRGW